MLDRTVVESALERIVSSPGFVLAPTQIRFLTFVVRETLEGRADQLKEYTIAVEALGRPTSFETTSSSVVRVAARQLRFKLQEYYRAEGVDDPVIVDLPKGGYVPTFRLRDTSSVTVDHSPPHEGTTSAAEQASLAPVTERFWLLRRAALLIPILAVLVFVVKGRDGSRESNVATPEAVAGPVIAVLPFSNLTGNSAEEFLSDGLADEITSLLASNPASRVIARTSAWKFKGQRVDIRDVGKQLGAAYVLEGSVLRSDSLYRVSVQLNSASDGVSVWTQQYEVARPSVFGLYDTIAQAVHEAISSHVNAATGAFVARRTTRDPEAQRLYLEGRFFWNQRTPESMQRAVNAFNEAIRRDSTFAQGWSSLAGALATMEVNHVTEPGVSRPASLAAADRALKLDPTLGEPWASIGLLRGFTDWDWAAADSAFAKAVRLSPNYATARSWYSNVLLARGRIDEALEQLEAAQRIDPLSAPIAYGIAQANYYGRRFSDGLKASDRMLDLNPGAHYALLLKGKLLKGAGKLADARAIFAEVKDSVELALLLEPEAKRREVLRLLAKISEADKRKGQFWVATCYAQIGMIDSSFVWLERAYDAHQPDLVSLKTDPMIDPAKADPRFDNLLRRIGLHDPGN